MYYSVPQSAFIWLNSKWSFCLMWSDASSPWVTVIPGSGRRWYWRITSMGLEFKRLWEGFRQMKETGDNLFGNSSCPNTPPTHTHTCFMLILITHKYHDMNFVLRCSSVCLTRYRHLSFAKHVAALGWISAAVSCAIMSSSSSFTNSGRSSHKCKGQRTVRYSTAQRSQQDT